MTRIDRRWAAAGVIALGALLLAGCAEGEPAAAPTVGSLAPSATPTPTAVAVAPEKPAGMEDDGAAGAEAAAKYFLELDAHMQASGETSIWESMSHQTCEYCAKRLEQADQIAASGDTFRGGEAVVQIVRRYAQDTATGIWPMDVRVSEAETTITRPDGTVAFQKDANTYTARVEVGRRDDAWVFVELANATSE